ncbi:DMT family transporter [Paracoccus nototheniae]|uniref:DMT family transporter n=1 Tax=Paracoccus nototheniae TaxID=2489002 RepID=A0ABW4DUD5_9RHOB|nr:DMT family transporter [Paracoccus nototheniae]
MHALFLTIAAVLAGAAVPFQGGANAALGRALGHPLWATLASLAISAICVIPVLVAIRAPLPLISSLTAQPKWVWIGGVAGVVYITAAILLMPRLGAAGFMTAVIAGQVVASLIIDSVGAVGLAARPVDITRLTGVAMVMLGAVVIQWPGLSKM